MSAALKDGRTRSDGWSTVEQSQLKSMIEARQSVRQIAETMGKSRSAIIGRAFRKGLKFKSRVVKKKEVARKKSNIKAKPIKHLQIQLGNNKPPRDFGMSSLKHDLAFNPENAPQFSKKVTLLQLENGMCKWPLFVDGQRLFCGAVTGLISGKLTEDELRPSHKIYCAHHAALGVSNNQKGSGL